MAVVPGLSVLGTRSPVPGRSRGTRGDPALKVVGPKASHRRRSTGVKGLNAWCRVRVRRRYCGRWRLKRALR